MTHEDWEELIDTFLIVLVFVALSIPLLIALIYDFFTINLYEEE